MHPSLCHLRAIFVVALPLLLSSLFVGAAQGQGASAQPTATAYLRHHHEDIHRILRRGGGGDAEATQRQTAVGAVVRSLLDLETMAEEALGEHWATKSAAERATFVSLLRELVERSYRKNLEGTRNFRVQYGEEKPVGARTLVETTARDARNPRAPAVSIHYTVRQAVSRFFVVDITTDGVSMVRNYRNQFSRIIRREGWDALLARMREKLAEES